MTQAGCPPSCRSYEIIAPLRGRFGMPVVKLENTSLCVIARTEGPMQSTQQGRLLRTFGPRNDRSENLPEG